MYVPCLRVTYITIVASPTVGKKYVCIQSYCPQRSDEVQLDKGSLITVLERNLDGWWLVE